MQSTEATPKAKPAKSAEPTAAGRWVPQWLWESKIDYGLAPAVADATSWYQRLDSPADAPSDKTIEVALAHAKESFGDRMDTCERLDKKAEWFFGIESAFVGGVFALVALDDEKHQLAYFVGSLLVLLWSMVTALHARSPAPRPAPLDAKSLLDSAQRINPILLLIGSYHVAAAGCLVVSDSKARQVLKSSIGLIVATVLFVLCHPQAVSLYCYLWTHLRAVR